MPAGVGRKKSAAELKAEQLRAKMAQMGVAKNMATNPQQSQSQIQNQNLGSALTGRKEPSPPSRDRVSAAIALVRARQAARNRPKTPTRVLPTHPRVNNNSNGNGGASVTMLQSSRSRETRDTVSTFSGNLRASNKSSLRSPLTPKSPESNASDSSMDMYTDSQRFFPQNQNATDAVSPKPTSPTGSFFVNVFESRVEGGTQNVSMPDSATATDQHVDQENSPEDASDKGILGGEHGQTLLKSAGAPPPLPQNSAERSFVAVQSNDSDDCSIDPDTLTDVGRFIDSLHNKSTQQNPGSTIPTTDVKDQHVNQQLLPFVSSESTDDSIPVSAETLQGIGHYIDAIAKPKDQSQTIPGSASSSDSDSVPVETKVGIGAFLDSLHKKSNTHEETKQTMYVSSSEDNSMDSPEISTPVARNKVPHFETTDSSTAENQACDIDAFYNLNSLHDSNETQDTDQRLLDDVLASHENEGDSSREAEMELDDVLADRVRADEDEKSMGARTLDSLLVGEDFLKADLSDPLENDVTGRWSQDFGVTYVSKAETLERDPIDSARSNSDPSDSDTPLSTEVHLVASKSGRDAIESKRSKVDAIEDERSEGNIIELDHSGCDPIEIVNSGSDPLESVSSGCDPIERGRSAGETQSEKEDLGSDSISATNADDDALDDVLEAALEKEIAATMTDEDDDIDQVGEQEMENIEVVVTSLQGRQTHVDASLFVKDYPLSSHFAATQEEEELILKAFSKMESVDEDDNIQEFLDRMGTTKDDAFYSKLTPPEGATMEEIERLNTLVKVVQRCGSESLETDENELLESNATHTDGNEVDESLNQTKVAEKDPYEINEEKMLVAVDENEIDASSSPVAGSAYQEFTNNHQMETEERKTPQQTGEGTPTIIDEGSESLVLVCREEHVNCDDSDKAEESRSSVEGVKGGTIEDVAVTQTTDQTVPLAHNRDLDTFDDTHDHGEHTADHSVALLCSSSAEVSRGATPIPAPNNLETEDTTAAINVTFSSTTESSVDVDTDSLGDTHDSAEHSEGRLVTYPDSSAEAPAEDDEAQNSADPENSAAINGTFSSTTESTVPTGSTVTQVETDLNQFECEGPELEGLEEFSGDKSFMPVPPADSVGDDNFRSEIIETDMSCGSDAVGRAEPFILDNEPETCDDTSTESNALDAEGGELVNAFLRGSGSNMAADENINMRGSRSGSSVKLQDDDDNDDDIEALIEQAGLKDSGFFTKFFWGASEDEEQRGKTFLKLAIPYLTNEALAPLVSEAQIRSAASRAGIPSDHIESMLEQIPWFRESPLSISVAPSTDTVDISTKLDSEKFDRMEDVDQSENISAFLNRMNALEKGGHFGESQESDETEEEEGVEIDVDHGFINRQLESVLSDEAAWWQHNDKNSKKDTGNENRGLTQSPVSEDELELDRLLSSTTQKEEADTASPRSRSRSPRKARIPRSKSGAERPPTPGGATARWANPPPIGTARSYVLPMEDEAPDLAHSLSLTRVPSMFSDVFEERERWVMRANRTKTSKWASPWDRRWRSGERKRSVSLTTAEAARAPRLGGVSAVQNLSKWTSRRDQSLRMPVKQHWRQAYKERTRHHPGYFNVDAYSLYEAAEAVGAPHPYDEEPWESRPVKQRFLHEKSISLSRNWFGDLLRKRGNDRYREPVAHPKSMEMPMDNLPGEGEWTEEWYTTWQQRQNEVKKRRQNGDSDSSSDSEESDGSETYTEGDETSYRDDDTYTYGDSVYSESARTSRRSEYTRYTRYDDDDESWEDPPECGTFQNVKQKIGERLSLVHPNHLSSLRQSRWRRKHFPRGTFPYK